MTKQLKILMLHGYTQSGPKFRAKTAALEKALTKMLPGVIGGGGGGVLPMLIYPDGPFRLSHAELPGAVVGGDVPESEDTDSYGWYRDDPAGNYPSFDKCARAVAAAVRGAGGIDAVVGFSQGAGLAAIVASALESGRQEPLGNSEVSEVSEVDQRGHGWATDLRDANGGRPLRFAVIYSGFVARPGRLDWLYEPRISTPTLHFLGQLDTVVDETRSRRLVERCDDPVVVVHPGGHYVPVSRMWVNPVVEFMAKYARDKDQ